MSVVQYISSFQKIGTVNNELWNGRHVVMGSMRVRWRWAVVAYGDGDGDGAKGRWLERLGRVDRVILST